MFAPRPDTVLTAEDGRDIASVDEAVDRLFTDIMARLRAIMPDVAIEFRHPYNGPLMRKYGNMLRGVDCPNAGPLNRKEIVDLRLLADHTAVHSDRFIWNPEEPVESAALQILNVLFSVPQVSVRITEASPGHREMIDFWMRYWRENRPMLLDGEFLPVSPAHNYPMVGARTAEKQISSVYQSMVVPVAAGGPAVIDVSTPPRTMKWSCGSGGTWAGEPSASATAAGGWSARKAWHCPPAPTRSRFRRPDCSKSSVPRREKARLEKDMSLMSSSRFTIFAADRRS